MKDLEISAEAVQLQLKRGEAIFFLEARRGGARELAGKKLRGALRLVDEDVQNHLDEIPRERPVVVYASAPDDEPAILAARLLLSKGFPEVQVLSGGLQACLVAGLAVDDLEARNQTRPRGL
jgi:rhodanese-related sulfurtransferase